MVTDSDYMSALLHGEDEAGDSKELRIRMENLTMGTLEMNLVEGQSGVLETSDSETSLVLSVEDREVRRLRGS